MSDLSFEEALTFPVERVSFKDLEVGEYFIQVQAHPVYLRKKINNKSCKIVAVKGGRDDILKGTTDSVHEYSSWKRVLITLPYDPEQQKRYEDDEDI